MPLDTVYLDNNTWPSVYVEARIGNNSDPMQNPSLGAKTLGKGLSWIINSDGEDVWYRRDADPYHHNGNMTPWTERACYGNGQTYHDQL